MSRWLRREPMPDPEELLNFLNSAFGLEVWNPYPFLDRTAPAATCWDYGGNQRAVFSKRCRVIC